MGERAGSVGRGTVWRLLLLGALLIGPLAVLARPHRAATAEEEALSHRTFIPNVRKSANPVTCAATGGYGVLTIEGPPTDRPPPLHADLNLALRGYQPTSGFAGLVDINGPTDPNAPQLYGLFGDQRTPTISELDRVFDWDWGCNCRGGPITIPAVTLIEAATGVGEALYLPDRSSGNIGQGYKALVLYADASRITLKYTREDSVVWGYTLHIEGIQVNRTLHQLYQACDQAGRGRLPALFGRQRIGTALGGAVGFAIRDTGRFMDPRSRKDWWRGR